MKTAKLEVQIVQEKLELLSGWGSQSVRTYATVEIPRESGAKEFYSITFVRDQITGSVHTVECEPREDSTEYTLSTETISELCLDKLNNY